MLSLCLAPAYGDGVMNGDETGVDCGGSNPTKCAQSITCKITADCDKALCTGGTCAGK